MPDPKLVFATLIYFSITSSQIEGKPNIVFVMVDDLGWANVGWHNPAPDNAQTPYSMELLKDGIELNHHYAFPYCSPSRSSFMSGRFPYHVQQFNFVNFCVGQGMHRNMTSLARKMKLAGYHTAAFGKWHLGCSSPDRIPLGLGFDESLIYFEGGEDHWNQRTCITSCLKPVTVDEQPFTDLWENDHPGHGLNNTGLYGSLLYTDHAVDFIRNHDPSSGPLFLYFPIQVNHAPLEVPKKYLDRYNSSQFVDRRIYNAMVDVWDEAVKNITDTLKTKGLWENTLFVLSSDNGGPVYSEKIVDFHGGGANNYPLRGGKVSSWEGGVRVSAFVSGGLIPSAMRGQKLNNLMHITDWYATFCELAGVDTFDLEAMHAGLPPVDSISLWPLLSGKNMSSTRFEIPLVIDWQNSSALIVGRHKFLQGPVKQSFWQGPKFPNHTHYGDLNASVILCGQVDPSTGAYSGGCLYDLEVDPTEHNDLAAELPTIMEKMESRLKELRKTHFQPEKQADLKGSIAQVIKNGGFWGPWLP